MIPKRARSAKILEEIIEQIAKEEGISNRKIDCILQAVFGQIANDIRERKLKGSHILYLGKFLVKPYKMIRFYDWQSNQITTEPEITIENKQQTGTNINPVELDGNNIENKG